MEVGRRKKEEAIKSIVSAINNVLTVLAVAMLTNATGVYLLLLLLLRVLVLLLSEFSGEFFSTDSEFEVAVADFLLIIIGTLRDRPQGRPKESMFLR
jgi:hypothetical protein